MIKWIFKLFKKKKLTNKEWWEKYRIYLKSSKWEKKRQKVLKRDKHRCRHRGWIFFRCKETKNLQVHHITYKRVFSERLSDLIVLCDYHHKVVHLKKDKLKLKRSKK